MFHSVESFYFFSFLSTLIGFQVLEKIKRAHGRVVPLQFFLSLLGAFAAGHYWHYRDIHDPTVFICWHGFAFLSTAPILGSFLFTEGLLASILRIVVTVLSWAGSFVWFSLNLNALPNTIFLLSLLPVIVLMMPYGRIWRFLRRRKQQKQYVQEERAKIQETRMEKEEKKRQKEKDRSLYEKLVRELGG